MSSAAAPLEVESPQTTPQPRGLAPETPLILAGRELYKTYQRGATSVPVLQGATVEIPRGSFYAIVGASGSGKSTLLHLLATLDQPDAGEVYFANQRIDHLGRGKRDRLRNNDFGMVFQFYHLLPELSALENVLLPSMIGRSFFAYSASSRRLRTRAKELLDTVGLSHRLHHKPRELSGGEIQRTAIARALMNDPAVLFADEPTGNLDRKTGSAIMELLISLNEQNQLTIVMVTHDQAVARRATSSLTLVDGRLRS